MPISIRPLHPVFVGEVAGVDCRSALSPVEVAAIEAGIDQYAVLVFREQNITDEEQLERPLKLRVLPTSRPRQVFDRRGLRFFRGRCVQNRSTKMAPPGPRYGQAGAIPTEICITVKRLTTLGGPARPRSPA